MTHTYRLRWRFGLINYFINRFLRKFENARNKCQTNMVIVDEKIADLKDLRTQFSKQNDVVGNFLSALKR